MKSLLKLAYRNVFRNKKRSIITLVGISVGLMAMVFGQGFMVGIGKQSEMNLIENETSHLKIFAEGYRDEQENLPLDISIESPEKLASEIEQIAHVQHATHRITLAVVLNNGINDYPCIGIGITPERDEQVFNIKDAIVEGGQYLKDGDEKMLIGSKLAEIFEVKAGDYLTVITRTLYDALDAWELEIGGIINTGNPNIDNAVIYLPLSLVQQSLEMSGKATEIAVKIDDMKYLEQVSGDILNKLGKGGIKSEVSKWDELAEDFIAIHKAKKSGTGLIIGIIVIVAAVGIANTMLMAAFERTREIGVLMALGMKSREIAWLFLLEGAILGLCGAFIGCLLGGGLTYYFEIYGWDISVYGDMDVGYPVKNYMYADLSLPIIIYTVIFGLAVSILASLYPARKAAKLEPTEALRFV